MSAQYREVVLNLIRTKRSYIPRSIKGGKRASGHLFDEQYEVGIIICRIDLVRIRPRDLCVRLVDGMRSLGQVGIGEIIVDLVAVLLLMLQLFDRVVDATILMRRVFESWADARFALRHRPSPQDVRSSFDLILAIFIPIERLQFAVIVWGLHLDGAAQTYRRQ